MMPKSLRNQQKLQMLLIAQRKGQLPRDAARELAILEGEAKKAQKGQIARALREAEAMREHQKKSQGVNDGIYAVIGYAGGPAML